MQKTLFVIVLTLLSSWQLVAQDLQITEVPGPLSFARHSAAVFPFTVQNDGIVAISTSTYVTAVLSADTELGDDMELGTIPIFDLAAHSSKEFTFNTYNGVTLPTGQYHLILIADYYNYLNETDESNNVFVGPEFVVTPADVDFSVSTSLADHAAVHEFIPADFQIVRTGTTAITGGSYIHYYLSEDEALGENDHFLDDFYFSHGEADTTTELSSYFLSIPNVTPGNYFILAVIDVDYAGNSVFDETDENNNIAISPIAISPSNINIKIDGAPMNASALSVGTLVNINIDFAVQNTGTTGVGNHTFNVYLSDDQVFDANDLFVNEYVADRDYDYLPSGTNKNHWISLHLSTEFLDSAFFGERYVVLVANEDQAIAESNFNDNVVISTSTINIQPRHEDVQVVSAQFNETYDALDTNLELDITFMNFGTEHSNGFTHYVLQITGTNNYWSFHQSHYLYPTQESSTTWNLPLDHPLPEGNYSLEIAPESGSHFIVPFTIAKIPPVLSGSIIGEDGGQITKGKLFLYKKRQNGTIEFTDKVDPFTGENFSFHIDKNLHTLYFIPDKTLYPQYVPTVWGKTAYLTPGSFLRLANDSTAAFEILKLNEMGIGSRVISGRVQGQNTSGRLSTSTTIRSVQGLTIVLMNEDNKLVGLTQTDESGYFEFVNIPDGTYIVVVSGGIEGTFTPVPVTVDVTENNAVISITSNDEGGIQTNVKWTQQITFGPLTNAVNQQSVVLSATSSSGLAITYAVDNLEIASVVGNVLEIHGEGVIEITATQDGDEEYLAADPVKQSLTIVILGVDDPLNTLTVLPNPTTGLLTFNQDTFNMALTLTDLAGRSHQLPSHNRTVDISNFQPGLYLLTVHTDHVKKVVKIIRR